MEQWFVLINRGKIMKVINQRLLTLASGIGMVIVAASAGAQTPANDPSDRLRQVLPTDIAQQVLAIIADARAHGLPAQALENRALKFAANGVDPKKIGKSIADQEDRMAKAESELEDARGRKPDNDEVEAAADASRKGVDGSAVSALAKSAPSGRSLAVPLFVIGSLVDRGLPSDAALQRVLDRLKARASDADLQKLPGEAANGQSNKPALTGTDLAATKRPAGAGTAGGAGSGRPTTAGPPAGVPANPGKKPATNPGKGR
jgi:hypothetical protein